MNSTSVGSAFFVTALSFTAFFAGCSSDSDAPGTGTGGSSGTGATPNSGGATPNSGGATPSSGGATPSSGGAIPSGGATPSSGGTPGAGGGPVTGGSATTSGGATATGGTNTSGGVTATGGSIAAGGATSTGGIGGSGGTAPAACPSTATAKPGDTSVTIQSGGLSRQYYVHVPPSYTGRTGVPLVVDLHPFLNFLPGDAADSQRQSSGYKQLSDKEGFIAVWPNGIDRAWNLGTCCTEARTVDDVGFIRDLVQKVKQDACIDAKRVYAVGYSNGGGLAHLLGCRAADVFAAVGPASFDLITEIGECTPSRPISEIAFRGDSDPIVPYAGGNPPAPPSTYPLDPVHFLGAEATFEKWSQIDGCTDQPVAGGGDANWDCKTRSHCDGEGKEGTQVTLCTGHTATSNGHVTGDAVIGWSMLKKHAMP